MLLVRRNYPPAQLRRIVRGWQRDIERLITRTRRTL